MLGNSYNTESKFADKVINYSWEEISLTEGISRERHYSAITTKKDITKTVEDVSTAQNIFRLSPPKPDKAPQLSKYAVPRKTVDAVITAVYENSVHCKVLVEQGPIKIQLPMALMPEKPYLGMPISIALDKSSGYVTPIVKVREAPEVDPSELKELDRLINSL